MKSHQRISKILLTLGLLIVVGYGALSYFNRAPDRTIPADPSAIISPANGKVIHIETIDESNLTFFKKDIENHIEISDIEAPYQVVVIEMNINNVHVQRSPIAGEIIAQEYFPGKFQNAIYSKDTAHLARENEKMLMMIQNDDLTVGVVQVAGIMARRIQSFVEIGDVLEKGETYGRITLGSQVVVIVPGEVEVEVEVGDILIDGETIVGVLE